MFSPRKTLVAIICFPQGADLKGHGLIKRDLNLRKMVVEHDKDGGGSKVIAKEFGFHQFSQTLRKCNTITFFKNDVSNKSYPNKIILWKFTTSIIANDLHVIHIASCR